MEGFFDIEFDVTLSFHFEGDVKLSVMTQVLNTPSLVLKVVRVEI